MKKIVWLALVLAMVLWAAADAEGQGTLVFNNLGKGNGLVRIHYQFADATAYLLNQDLNFALVAGSRADSAQIIHVWLLRDGSAKGINVGPGRFADQAEASMPFLGSPLARWPSHKSLLGPVTMTTSTPQPSFKLAAEAVLSLP